MKRLLVLALGLMLAGTALTATATPAQAESRRPNVVFILTDDMRMDDMQYMRYTQSLFNNGGAVFDHGISPHPLCCPARAGLVTGKYAQNNGVHHNMSKYGGYGALNSKHGLIFQWYRRAGYRTNFVGKFLNGYKGGRIPGLVNNQMSVDREYLARGVVTYNNGNPKRRRGHTTHMVTNQVRKMINRSDGAKKRPFFIWAGYIAPHLFGSKGNLYPPIPPKKYRGMWRDPSHKVVPSMQKASFNHQSEYKNGRTVSKRYVRELHRKRVRSLYAVDDGVRRIVNKLKSTGEYRNTIIVFTSDNGYMMGEHGLFYKNNPYQESLRVPIMMTGPGVPAGHYGNVATLVDLPKTLAQLSNVKPNRVVDGSNMFNLPQNRAVLIQAGAPKRRWSWRGVYTRDFTYVVDQPSGKVGLFHRDGTDPSEINNRAGSHPRQADLHAKMQQLLDCKSWSCRRTFN